MDFIYSGRPTDRDEGFTGVVEFANSIVEADNDPPIPIDEACWIIDKRSVIETTACSSVKFPQLQSAASYARVTKLGANYAATEKMLDLSEKRRHHQQVLKRYLRSPTDFTILLKTSLQDLRNEVESLEYHCQHLRMSQAADPPNDIWRVAAEYFRLIRHGLHLTTNQIGIIRDIMNPDVVFNSEYGPGSIMQHWCFMDWFGDVNVELEGWEMLEGEALVALTTTRVTVTANILRNVFPHLRTIDNSDRSGKLAEQLLDQQLVMHGSTCFEWDDLTCRLTRVIFQSDMMTPMVQILDSLEDVSRVFEQALISPELQWKQTLYHNTFPLQCRFPPMPRLY
ncbi:hypothetical protein GN244_ATG13186 [Phytophthora infestans]|uniref:Uncharacterized protein n=1 Tax=Phytophthora infestans TaxID=4787 RepID=A0A833SLG1_PHYIN|nr:hypothetical protein GN244_ATG13186 [Phytophthora infestans]KAF4131002.1 hypothetical protein GN958_ATG19806 [Phytophthora infestans]